MRVLTGALKSFLWAIGIEDHGEMTDKEVREFFTMRAANLVRLEQEELAAWLAENKAKLERVGWKKPAPQLRVVPTQTFNLKSTG